MAGRKPAVGVMDPWFATASPVRPHGGLVVDEVPVGPEWQYEPKWDGFRCLVFRDGDTITLQSKSGKPLTRYFPDVVEAVRTLKARTFVLDGEIVVPEGKVFSFDALLQRIHPAASRVQKLAKETPAMLIVFDLLQDADGAVLVDEPLTSAASGWRRLPEAIFRRAAASGYRPRPPSSPTQESG